MTEPNPSSDRVDRLEDLITQVVSIVSETSQQIREISVQIKAQETFHDRFEQELSELKKLIQFNAKAIQANGEQDLERTRYELASIRELRRSIRNSY